MEEDQAIVDRVSISSGPLPSACTLTKIPWRDPSHDSDRNAADLDLMILTCGCKVNRLAPHELAPVQGGEIVKALDAQVNLAFSCLERLALFANKELVGRELAQRITSAI